MTKISKKLVQAMKSVDAVVKRGKNEKQNYAYVKATDVANEVRSALVEHGISFAYNVLEDKQWEKTTSSGATMNFCSLKVAVTFTDTESGEYSTGTVIGWGADSLDKAPYKAMTGALKYALRMNFLIPDESDPENDRDEKRETKQPSNIARTATGFKATNADLPKEMFDGTPVIQRAEPPLDPELRKVSEEMDEFVPLTEKRNEDIQNRLKQLVEDKVFDRRKLMLFLDKQHDGKKSKDVAAPQWEETLRKIEEAAKAGPEAIKTLLKGEA